MAVNLLSTTTRVEAPFIIATIAGVTFGKYSTEYKNIINENHHQKIISQYPNYMTSLTITKLNGTFNTYVLTMTYPITQNDDPNLLDKVFAKAGIGGIIKLSYGDYSMPSYIYKEEEAIISSVKSNLDIAGSSIKYTINCISTALKANAGTFNFPRRQAKPSDVIFELLQNSAYNLTEIFYGMSNIEKVRKSGLIATDDKSVMIEAQYNTTILDYLNYLVSNMTNISDLDDSLKKSSKYMLSINDDIGNDLGGVYFRIVKVNTKETKTSLDTYEINIGAPGTNPVISFNINDDQSYSILYNYSEKVNQRNYVSYIDQEGNLSYEFHPQVSNVPSWESMSENYKSWWTQVTQFPIQATMVIKGLLRPSILMTYLRINVYFYGRKHISSGQYMITKQVDTVDSSGYRTTLNLTRIGSVEL